MEEMYIKAIKASIVKLKAGGLTSDIQSQTKVKAAKALNLLKGINEPMYDELLADYKKTLAGLK